MGKDLKGKELGPGVMQRKDGKYSGRYTGADGKRHEQYFNKVSEAKKYVALGKIHKDETVDTRADNLTVDEWYRYWMSVFKSSLAPNTQRNYRDRYERDIKPRIGKMRITDVRAMHCQQIINDMDGRYSTGTIYQTYICMGSMLKSAMQNDIIPKQPLNGVVMPRVKKKSAIHFLTVEEQERFVAAAKKTRNASQFLLVLQTGLRTGELIGLTWDCVDFENRVITVEKQMEYRYQRNAWRAAAPKTMAGFRKIPMTDEAYEILKKVYEKKPFRKESPLLDQELEYFDPRTGRTKRLRMKDLVFVNFRTGEPTKNSSYDTNLYKICENADIKPFCMHALRHTFATRCIERGVQPKALQKILGHSNLATTMDTYVHVTDESLEKAMAIFEKNSTPISSETA